MLSELELLHVYWLFALPLPWIWLYKRSRLPKSWPPLIPKVVIRYPPLESDNQLSTNDPDIKKTVIADKLAAVALTLMIVSLSQPVRYGDFIDAGNKTESVDLVLVVSTAISMQLEDYVIDNKPVDRMTMVRQMLEELVGEFSGRRIGLVIYGSPPMLWLPFTEDRSVVKKSISRIRATLGGRLTDIGATLELVQKSYSSEQEAMVLVVSDGGLQLGEQAPVDAAKALRAAGFILHVAAVGALDTNAVQTGVADLIYQPVNLTWLQQLADAGGGKMFHAIDSDVFKESFKRIEKSFQGNSPESSGERLRVQFYPLPLGVAVFLLLMAVFIEPLSGRNKQRSNQ